MADEFSADAFSNADDSVEGLPQAPKVKKKKKKKKAAADTTATSLTGGETYGNDLFEDQGGGDEEEGPAGRAQGQSDFDKGASVFSDEDMQKEHLENRNRLMLGKGIQVVAAFGIAFLSWGLWAAYVTATSTCYLHGGPDNNNAEGTGDDPCMEGNAGFCMIGAYHSNAHNSRELCEGCGCHGQDQASANNAIDQKDGTFQSYLFADDTGRAQNVQDGTDATKASGQSASSAWACTCGEGKWIDGYCDCSAFEDCMLTMDVNTQTFCETIDEASTGSGTLGTAVYGENAAVWTKEPGGVGTCTGAPRSPETYTHGCIYTFDHPVDFDEYGNQIDLPFSDQPDRCPNGCDYTPAPGVCSVPTWQRHVETQEDCAMLSPPHEWKDGHMDEGIWNNWILAGLIICILDGGVLAFFWFAKGWQDAEAWGYIDIAL